MTPVKHSSLDDENGSLVSVVGPRKVTEVVKTDARSDERSEKVESNHTKLGFY